MSPAPKGIVIRFLLIAIAFLYASLWAQEKRNAESLLTVRAGMLPIILSAPHGGRAPIPDIAARRGIGVPQFTTERDSNTDELAEKITMKMEEKLGARPFLVIVRFERKYIDANRAQDRAYESAEARPYYLAYHRALAQACDQVRRSWGRGLLLDIHGQGAEVQTIFRGTENGRSTSALERVFGREAIAGRNSILGQMAERGYKIVPPLMSREPERRYSGGYTTQTYGSHRASGIDTMQLELGTSLRSRANLERTAADFADAIVEFAREYLPAVRLTGSKGSNGVGSHGVVE